MKLVTAEQMRTLEARAVEAGISEADLMERAGQAVAQEAAISAGIVEDRIFLVLVGPGNNGGDGLVAARHLREWDVEVVAYLLRPRPEPDAPLQAAIEAGVEVVLCPEDPGLARLDEALGRAVCVIDALLGTGTAIGQGRAIEGDLAAILERLALARSRPVVRPKLVACDIPTGIDPDTGRVDPATVEPDLTVSFGHAKVGTYTTPGALLSGEVVRVDIGIPADASTDLPYDDITLSVLRPLMPPRPVDAHKGTFGRATLAGGSRRYPGALLLAAEAAARSGAGLVELAAPADIQPLLIGDLPDAVHLPLSGTDGALDETAARALLGEVAQSDALLVGPGLSLTAATEAFMRALLAGLDAACADGRGPRAVVFDADALNALARIDRWWEQLALPRVLTPHPGEMARLLGVSVDEVQRGRLAAATEYAQRTGSVVVLKGAGTMIAAPDGRGRLSNLAEPALARAGSGDVLAGMVAGFIAQGMAPFDAATAAVYLHGECGKMVGRALGAAASLASDLLRALPEARKAMEP